MSRIAVLGSIHMDYVVTVDRIPKIGETIIGESFKKTPGGKGANQAVAASRLGADVYMIGKVGKDQVGDELLRNLVENGVNVYHVKHADTHSGLALIFVDRDGKNVIAVAPGADHHLSERDVDEAFDAFGDEVDILLVQLEIPLKTVEHAVKKFSKNGGKIVLNPAPFHPLSDEVWERVYVATPNEVELELMSGVEIKCIDDLILAGRKVLEELGVKNLVVTLGARGALLMTGKESKIIPAFKVQPIDTTGAGDAFNAALAVAISEEKTLEEAVTFANAAAALSTLKLGAQESLPTLNEVKQFLLKNQHKK